VQQGGMLSRPLHAPNAPWPPQAAPPLPPQHMLQHVPPGLGAPPMQQPPGQQWPGWAAVLQPAGFQPGQQQQQQLSQAPRWSQGMQQ
jgi:hypothetical protein